MKKMTFISLLITTHLVFIFLHIYKNALFTQELFTKQRYDKEIQELRNQQSIKKNELLALQNQEAVTSFAHNTLGFVPLALNQIRRLS